MSNATRTHPRTDAYARSKPTPERWEWIDKCEQFERELTAAQAEALKLQERIEALENEKMELQKQHQQFGDNAFENALSLVNHRNQLQEENARLHHLLSKTEIAIAFANREPGVIRIMGDDYTLLLQEIRSKLKAKDAQ